MTGQVSLPVLTERSLMRLPRPGDAEQLHALVYGDAAVMRYAGYGPHRDIEFTRGVLRGYRSVQESLGYSMWVVQGRADGRLLGECGLQPLADSPDDVEIGCALARTAWGQGLALELTGACVQLAFTVLGLNRVCAVVRPANTASQSVVTKLGMRLYGRRSVYGGEHDFYVLERGSPPAGTSR